MYSPALVSSCFLIIVIPTDGKGYLIVVFISISLMSNNVEHFFMHLLAICKFFPWNSIYSDLVPICYLDFFFFCCCVVQAFYIYWISKSYQICMICQYFLPFGRFPFHFANGLLTMKKLFSFIQFQSVLLVLPLLLVSNPKNSLVRQMSRSSPPSFFLEFLWFHILCLSLLFILIDFLCMV